jgi:hypothetical protein
LVIDYQFNSVGKFVNGLAPASKDGLWGYIDTKGKWKIEPQFTSAERFSNGVAVVCVGESSWECLYTFINSKGKQLFKPFILGTLDFTAPMLFQEGFFACVIAPKTYGYVSRTGEIIWSTEF